MRQWTPSNPFRFDRSSHSNNSGATIAPRSSKKLKGKKRSLALENPISNPNANSSTAVAGLGLMMKACKDVLMKLRKHKSGWVFYVFGIGILCVFCCVWVMINCGYALKIEALSILFIYWVFF